MILLEMLWLDPCREVSMIILLAAVFIRQAALRLWDLAHGNLGRTCLIQFGYSCQTIFVKQNIHCTALHCIALPHSCTVWRVRLHLRLPFTLHLQYIVWYCLLFTHAKICYNYENVWKSRIKDPYAFHFYELYKYWMSIPFFQAQDVGSRLAAIRRTDSGRNSFWTPKLWAFRVIRVELCGSIHVGLNGTSS
jgi:hypothetical protein